MSAGKDKGEFHILGIDLDSSQMMVLKAVMAAAGGPSILVTFKEINAHLQKLQKKKYSKAYIYRQLADLEKEGYIVSEQDLGKAREFQISESAMVKSLSKKREQVESDLLVKKQQILAKLELLKTTSSESISFVVYNQLMGLESSKTSIIIEGVENVRNTVVREFGKASESGDIIRVIAPSGALDRPMEQSGMAEMSLMVKAAEGVKVIGLLMPDSEQSVATELVVNYIQNIGETFTKYATTGNILMRIAKENIKTYRMVSLNREKMLLYLTHAATSDMAALIYRKDNPGLIDDAVDTFDRIFEEGIDIIELIRKMLAGKK